MPSPSTPVRSTDATVGDLADDPELNSQIQLVVDDANKAVSRAESIRRTLLSGFL